MESPKYIKFIGKFKDLKPMGYKFANGHNFTKMFSANYRCWNKSIEKNGYLDIIWIWSKGKEVQINDLHQWSYTVIEELINKKRKGYRHDTCNLFPIPDPIGKFILDIKTGELIDWSVEMCSGAFFFNKQKETGKKLTEKDMREYYDRYRTVFIQDDLLTLVIELIDKNMITISEVGN